MSGELEPELARGQRDILMSDADRERVVARLHSAVSEGRITLAEFQERVDGVLRARRYGEIEPFLAGLPSGPGPGVVSELRTVASSLKRTGSWPVPQTLRVHSKAGSVKLDFTEATIVSPVVEVVLDVYAASTTLVLPVGATADVDGVELVAGSLKAGKVPRQHESAGGVHFVVTGTSRAGSVKVRHKRHFLWWHW
jgi:Domain of unknown function (DUF1707)